MCRGAGRRCGHRHRAGVLVLVCTLISAAHASRAAVRLAYTPPCDIQVIGVGGGGGNAVDRMVTALGTQSGLELVSMNTDVQALTRSLAPKTLQLGPECARGLGAGGKPEVGREAALECYSQISACVAGKDLVFITAGFGGGTGSGAAPVVAQAAKSAGALTVGVVSKPFSFEGGRRMQQALACMQEMQQCVDILITVPNDRLLEIMPALPVQDAFRLADEVLRQGIVGLSDLILKPGLINVDFADVRRVVQDGGVALLGIGRGAGEMRAIDAAGAAVSSPLLEVPMRQAKRIVYSVTGPSTMSLQEVSIVGEVISEVADPDANIIFGAAVDDSSDELTVTVVATGLTDE